MFVRVPKRRLLAALLNVKPPPLAAIKNTQKRIAIFEHAALIGSLAGLYLGHKWRRAG